MIRAYLMLYCPIGSTAEASLREFAISANKSAEQNIYQNRFSSRGSSFSPPFFAFEIGFKQEEFNYEALTIEIDTLFSLICREMDGIKRISRLSAVNAVFAIVFNCSSNEDKPAFELTISQVRLLAEIGASFSSESYFEF